MQEIQRSKEYNSKTGKWEMMFFKSNKKGHVSVAPKHKALEKVKGYKHAVSHTIHGEKRGYKDPKTGLVHPSKGAYKDRYQG